MIPNKKLKPASELADLLARMFPHALLHPTFNPTQTHGDQ